MRRTPKPIYQPFIVLCFILIFGALSCWQLFEQDLLWQVRAGTELFFSRSFPIEETWTFSSVGRPWFNVQWLSTLISATIFHLARFMNMEAAGLVIFRALLLVVLMSLVWKMILRFIAVNALQNIKNIWWQVSLLCSAWCVIQFRVEVRADFYVLILAAWALLRMNTKFIFFEQLAYLILAYNLHPGVEPFLLLMVISCFIRMNIRNSDESFKSIVLKILIFTLVPPLVSPYPKESLQFIWNHMFYFSNAAMENPEHKNMSLSLFDVRRNGFTAVIFLSLLLMSLIDCLSVLRTYIRNKMKFLCVVEITFFFVILFLAFNRTRSWPFVFLYLLPFILSNADKWRITLVKPVTLAMVMASVWHWYYHTPLWGLTYNEFVFPVKTTEFINHHDTPPNLYHSFATGAYLVGKLTNQKVFVDTREYPFWYLQPLMKAAYTSKEITEELLKRYEMQSILVKYPESPFQPEVGRFKDILNEYTSYEQWALVNFDETSLLLVNRKKWPEDMTAQYEWTVFKPHMPVGSFFLSQKISNGLLEKYVSEVLKAWHLQLAPSRVGLFVLDLYARHILEPDPAVRRQLNHLFWNGWRRLPVRTPQEVLERAIAMERLKKINDSVL